MHIQIQNQLAHKTALWRFNIAKPKLAIGIDPET